MLNKQELVKMGNELRDVLKKYPEDVFDITFADIGLTIDDAEGIPNTTKVVDALSRNLNVSNGTDHFQMRPLEITSTNESVNIFGIDYGPFRNLVTALVDLYRTTPHISMHSKIKMIVPELGNIDPKEISVVRYKKNKGFRASVLVYAQPTTRDKVLEKLETFVLAIDNGKIEVINKDGEKEDIVLTTAPWNGEELEYANVNFIMGEGYFINRMLPNKYAVEAFTALKREIRDFGKLNEVSKLKFNHMIDILPFVGVNGDPKFIEGSITVRPKVFVIDKTGVSIRDGSIDELDLIDINDERILVGFNSHYFDSPSLEKLKYYNFSVPKVNIQDSTVMKQLIDDDFEETDIRLQVMVIKNILSVNKGGVQSALPLLYIMALDLMLWFNLNIDIDVGMSVTNPCIGLVSDKDIERYESQRDHEIMDNIIEHVDFSEKYTGIVNEDSEYILETILRADYIIDKIIPNFDGLTNALRDKETDTDNLARSILSILSRIIAEEDPTFIIGNKSKFNNFVADVISGDLLFNINKKLMEKSK